MHLWLNDSEYFGEKGFREYIEEILVPIMEIHMHDNTAQADQHMPPGQVVWILRPPLPRFDELDLVVCQAWLTQRFWLLSTDGTVFPVPYPTHFLSCQPTL